MFPERVQALDRIIAILDCFSVDAPSLGVREVARMIHLSPSTTGRLMQGLREAGLLTQDARTSLYSIGPRVLTWAGVYSASLDVRTIALPRLQSLHRETQETISLYILDGSERICVERLESTQNVRYVARLGRRLPLFAGSAGKLLLAFLPYHRQEDILNGVEIKQLTPATITNREKLYAELQAICRQGYSISHGEWIQEASGVAAPIFDLEKQVVAAITISGPTQRFKDDTISQYITKVVQVAGEISRDMGYQGGRFNSIENKPIRQIEEISI